MKSTYNSNRKKYDNWYLFHITDRCYSDAQIEVLFTNHAPSDIFLSYNNASDSKTSDSVMSDSSGSNITTPNNTLQPSQANETVFDITMLNCKWSSPESLKFFKLHLYYERKAKGEHWLVDNQKEGIIQHLHDQMLRFKNGWLKFDGWKEMLNDKDTDDLYTPRDIFVLRNRCK